METSTKTASRQNVATTQTIAAIVHIVGNDHSNGMELRRHGHIRGMVKSRNKTKSMRTFLKLEPKRKCVPKERKREGAKYQKNRLKKQEVYADKVCPQ